jgi:hypothetical protein
MWHCMESYCKKVAYCSGCRRVESGSETDLLDALYTIGPIRLVDTLTSLILIIIKMTAVLVLMLQVIHSSTTMGAYMLKRVAAQRS